MSMHATEETPDQLIQKLELMGEEEVRSRLARGHFQSRKIPLVNGWLQRLDEKRNETQLATQRLSDRAEERRQAQVRSLKDEVARVERQARLALIIAGVSGGLALLSLFALALTR